MKAISYSLFGFNKDRIEGCFDFNSYCRGLMVNIRFNRVIYPGWTNVLSIDGNTYNSPYKPFFDWLVLRGLLRLNLCPNNEPLCKAMLWRLQPVFFTDQKGHWEYSHVLCRDIDSICTYREAQAVQQWIEEDKTIHCITDSVSHNIPMMGGMIGFRPAYLSSRMGVNSFDELIDKNPGIGFGRKGSDQDFLNRVIYPKCAESSTEHYVLGMVRNLSEGNGRHYSIPDIKIDVDEKYKYTNTVCGHIGSAGYYTTPTEYFLNTMDPYREEYKEIESQFPTLFYWSA